MRVVFPFVAQAHQVPHAIPVAAEMALAHPDVEVQVACSSDEQEAMARRIMGLYEKPPVHYRRLDVSWLARGAGRLLGASVPAKELVMLQNRHYLAGFDAIVVPERTSLFLKRIGVSRPKLVWTTHGSGDRALSYAPDINQFDFVLLAGQKQEQRMLADGLVRPGAYVTGCYPKFDFLHRLSKEMDRRLFDNQRPTVVYAPHFRPALSSWPRDGFKVLDFFAASDEFNLIFAPHVRLFDPPSERDYRRFDAYRHCSNMIIDLGSLNSIDMTYMLSADIYLGDVSSQVTEFLINPRPCVFLNSHGADWRHSPDYLFWQMGTVVDSVKALRRGIADAIAHHGALEQRQRTYFAESFTLPEGHHSARRGADAIVEFVKAATD